jgi:hypothetical protein
MRALVLFVSLISLAASGVSAQVRLDEAIYLPPRFFVGDRVELRLTYEVPAGLTASPPVQLPTHAWIDYQDVEVQDRRKPGEAGRVIVRVFFVPFSAGETVLPPVQLGGFDTGELLVSTQSALELEQEQTLRGPRRQLNLPLTWLRLLALAAAGFGSPLLLVFLLRTGVRGYRRLREARMRRLPYLHVRKSLNQLAAGSASMEGKSFFILLSLTVRRYLSERFSMPLMSATTGEIAGSLKTAGLDDSVSERIHEVLKAADLFKFSGKRTGRREMERSLKTACSIVEQVEERTAHVET